jgi:hypothetical protein
MSRGATDEAHSLTYNPPQSCVQAGALSPPELDPGLRRPYEQQGGCMGRPHPIWVIWRKPCIPLHTRWRVTLHHETQPCGLQLLLLYATCCPQPQPGNHLVGQRIHSLPQSCVQAAVPSPQHCIPIPSMIILYIVDESTPCIQQHTPGASAYTQPAPGVEW